MNRPPKVGFVYNPHAVGAKDLVNKLVDLLELDQDVFVCAVGDLENIELNKSEVELIITVGGDGTILRTVHTAATKGLAILGINMGRLGFMTELSTEDVFCKLQNYIKCDMWLEARAMLNAKVITESSNDGISNFDVAASADLIGASWHALNEAVVGSGAVSRMTSIKVSVDDVPMTVYRADSVIVSTATGSTGYSLSAGGPILHPLSSEILIMPVAPHTGLRSPVVLPATSRIVLTVLSDRPAMLSIDGFIDRELIYGQSVEVTASNYSARFLRAKPPSHHYAVLTRRLGLDQISTP